MDLDERLRREARAQRTSMTAFVLAAIEEELSRREWRERWARRSPTDLGVPAAELLTRERSARDPKVR